jgi:alkanesulfonate monooxygenase SsuD/methylene tetrahydromethanopterin reductase-like flavin-dependent oxidoreductase (luciferase family)
MLLHSTHLYRSFFRPSEVLQQPWLMVGVPVIASDSDAAARRLFTTPQQRFLRLIRNQPVELLPPVETMDKQWTDWERAAVDSRLAAAIIGSETTVKAGLEKLISETGADEIIAVTDTWDHESRLDSYRRLASVASSIEMKRLVDSLPRQG